ncbi:cysteine-rich with EGF-like domain protein 2 [Coccinella septempunctata]|uniref:cysteine-rich with EGF-like domain protein 2 n=1 Tax=Coccinella septempunctata TaxID=41139 RepID=UPI001D06CBED|nr:cysteine-rich with EGF-like domain protein 2 [Coccinella septempunctata]
MDEILLKLTIFATVAILVPGTFSGEPREALYKKKFPPCKSCKVFIDSFQKIKEEDLEKTLEKVCLDVVEGRDQCVSFKEEHLASLNDWWSDKKDQDVFNYLCIDGAKVCCPENHYGANCTQCEGYPGNVCNNNGKCKGAGTRKGNGKCHCDEGYTNEKCDQCASGYFEAYRDENKLLCTKCHPSCDGPCNKPGPEGCEKCNVGWLTDKEKGCLDVNECAAPKSPCRINQFCVNSEGSFRCLSCDSSCHSCTGDGPDMCKKCAKGFVMKDKLCVDSEQESRKQHMYITRYLTYLGLCVATCIIFNKNTVLAAVIGIVVAIYISTSEYVLNSHPTPKTDNIAQTILNKISS